ncbi:GNAT family N-acetyltransferase, partial [Pseudomonas aeruginosa]|uniref:GNAT family N-acetyltransferase n=1 Tax=Pseudomonas aeruginosa TaxID=287 RepID=UPI0039680B8D
KFQKAAIAATLPKGTHHQLPMLGVHPEYQGRQIGEQLLAAVQRWCAEDSASQGLVLDTGNAPARVAQRNRRT